ncbi:MAG: alpha/beta hydrolase fold domain-containing protein [Planctomycetota bacterium]
MIRHAEKLTPSWRMLCLFTLMPLWSLVWGLNTVAAQPATAKQSSPGNKQSSADKSPTGTKMVRDIPYITDGDDAQKLDLYLPEQSDAKARPLIVHIHGGGWMGGNRYPCPVAHLVGRGYVVASVGYRFSQKAIFPAQIQDCLAAIRWLRANHEKYGIDRERVGVVGGSAGGHLSALVGTTGGRKIFPAIGGHEEQTDRVQVVCDYFGPKNFGSVMKQAAEDPNVKNIFKFNSPSDPYSRLIGVSLEGNSAQTNAVSPIYYVTADCPPTLMLHGTHDALVPYAQSEEFAAALKSKGVPVWLQKLPGSGHGGAAFSKPQVTTLIHNFFDKHLLGLDVPIELAPENEVAVAPPK